MESTKISPPAHSPLSFVQAHAALAQARIDESDAGFFRSVTPETDAKLAVLVTPHPDDEVFMGGWARRLQVEEGWRVHVLSLTLGSREDRRAARRRELEAACEVLGWELEVLDWQKLDDADVFPKRVSVIAEKLHELKPARVFLPHPQDAHPTHEAASRLTEAALAMLNEPPEAFYTEYWQPMSAPDTVISIDEQTLAELLLALCQHRGEVERNAYHLRLPAWMMDNARRAERIAGMGSAPPASPFACLYGRVRRGVD